MQPAAAQKRFYVFFLLIAAIYVFLLAQFRWTPERRAQIIDSDGKGYHAYLKTLFIDHDFGREPFDADYHVFSKGGRLNKYTAGVALMQSPFFAAACAWAKAGGFAVDGVSLPFQVMVSVAGLFYFLAGLFFLRKILLRFGSSEMQATFILFVAAMGTPLLHYTVMGAALSHVYSFFLVTLFIYFSLRLKEDWSLKSWSLLALAAGLIVLVRPLNGLVLLLAPAFAGDRLFFAEFFALLKRPRKLFLPLLIFILPLSVQLFLWHAQTGRWIEWSYQGEGFYFSQPQFSEVFVSARKGLLVYYPVLIPCFLGLFSWREARPATFWWTSIFLLLLSWLLASWWCWDYGESFGMRPFTDFMGLFLLLLAAALQWKSKWGRGAVVALAVLASALNIIYTYQFNTGILARSAMTAEKLRYIFLRTGENYREALGGVNDLPPYAPEGLQPWKECKLDYAAEPQGLKNAAGQEFPGGCEFFVDERLNGAAAFFTRIRFDKKIAEASAAKDALIVVHVVDAKGVNKHYNTYRFKQLPQEPVNEWRTEEHAITTVAPLSAGDKISVYLYNPQKESFLLDGLEVRVFYP